MKIIQKLYTIGDVKALIVDTVSELVGVYNADNSADVAVRLTKMTQFADTLYADIVSAVAEEVVRRHVQGIALAVWAGPPGSGKGTNIDTVQWIGKIYAEVVSQGGAAQLPEFIHKTLLSLSLSQGSISTGTKGIFNQPVGEYAELFDALKPVLADLVAKGGFPSDGIVSLLVAEMILLRLVEGYHRIQIDLWPRTINQLQSYKQLVNAILAAGGKIDQELVNIRVLPAAEVAVIAENPEEAAQLSITMGKEFIEATQQQSYKDSLVRFSVMQDPKERFAEEYKLLEAILGNLRSKYTDKVGTSLVHEIDMVVSRMVFRFNKALEVGAIPRPDEYPLSLVKRLGIYASETSPAFLMALSEANNGVKVHIISSFDAPEVVIRYVLDDLVREKTVDPRWESVKVLAGDIAIDIVNRKELIVDALVQRMGGILRS